MFKFNPPSLLRPLPPSHLSLVPLSLVPPSLVPLTPLSCPPLLPSLSLIPSSHPPPPPRFHSHLSLVPPSHSLSLTSPLLSAPPTPFPLPPLPYLSLVSWNDVTALVVLNKIEQTVSPYKRRRRKKKEPWKNVLPKG